MNLKRIKIALASMVVIGLTFTACSGDDGDAGPAGPAGINGANGAAGPAGPAGPQGPGIMDTTFTIDSLDWKNPSAPTGNSIFRRDTVALAMIDQSIVDEGAVFVYVSNDLVNPQWGALPQSRLIVVGGVFTSVNIQFTYDVGNLYLEHYAEAPAVLAMSDMLAKVIVVPPAALMEDVDWENYEEVRSVYGIQEFEIK